MRIVHRCRTLLVSSALVSAALLLGTCGSPSDPNPDSMSADCVMNPMTHVEIINSCADVLSFDKPAQLPKFQAGAPLQPLP